MEGAIWKHETGYEGGLSLKSKEVYFEVVEDGNLKGYFCKSGRVYWGMAKTFSIIFLPYFPSGWLSDCTKD